MKKSQRGLRGCLAVWILALLWALPVWATPLFKGQPKPVDVGQGNAGTCYVHAVAIAAAKQQPRLISGRLSETGLGDAAMVSMQMGNGHVERMLKKDLEDARLEGADLSNGGLWMPG